MRLGRNFTNLLNRGYLSTRECDELARGQLSVADMDARAQIAAKTDIAGQLEAARSLGLEHIEIGGNLPNPYLDLIPGQEDRVRRVSRDCGVTLSMHIPCTGVAASIASLQEADRQIAVGLVKRYVDVAALLGADAVNLHPGSVPAYLVQCEYRDRVFDAAVRSVADIARHAARRPVAVYVENNSIFEGIGYDLGECAALISAVNRTDAPVRLCFDVGHWLSGVDPAKLTPAAAAAAIESVPSELVKGAQMHLNDYDPAQRRFHVPLHRRQGLLTREMLAGLLGACNNRGVRTAIIETVAREASDVLDAAALMRDEQTYVGEILSAEEAAWKHRRSPN